MSDDDDNVLSNQQQSKEEDDAPMTSAMMEGGDDKRESKKRRKRKRSSASSDDDDDGSAAAPSSSSSSAGAACSSSSSSSSSSPPVIDRSKPPSWNDKDRASDFKHMLGRVGARAAWSYFDRAGAPPIDDDATAVVTSAAMAQSSSSSSSSSSSASTPRAIRIPYGACFECAELGNADLWYTLTRPIGSTTTLTGQLGIRIQVKSSMLIDDEIQLTTARKKLHQYEGMLIVWVRVPKAVYDIVAAALYDNKAVVFTIAMLQACEFYMAPMGKRGPAKGKAGPVIKGDANNGGIDDVFESDLYAKYNNMTPGHVSRVAFDAYFTQLRAPTDSEDAILAHVQRIWAMGAARFDLRTLIETEWQLGGDTNYTEQRSLKILIALFTRMGFVVDICREGGDVDLVLNGHIRVEVKSNHVTNALQFDQSKQQRMTDEYDGTRRCDLVIQHYFNNIGGDWSRFVVIPWQAFNATTAEAADVPLVRMTEQTIARESCDQYNIVLGSDGWFGRLINIINLAGGVATSIPDPNLTAPNAVFLRSIEYLTSWLRIPDVLFTHRHTMPSSLPTFIAAVNPGFVDPTIASFRYVPQSIDDTGHAAWTDHRDASAAHEANRLGDWPACKHPRAVCAGSLRDHPEFAKIGLYVNINVDPCGGQHDGRDKMKECLRQRGIANPKKYANPVGGVINIVLFDANAQRIDAQEAADHVAQMKKEKADNKKKKGNKNNQEEKGEEDEDEEEDA